MPETMALRMIFIGVFSLAVISACGAKPHLIHPHIQKGSTAEPHSHPWLLSMKYPIFFGDQHFCGASLIRVPYSNDSSDIVITAAHCIGAPGTKECNEYMKLPGDYVLVASDHDQVEMDTGEMSATVAHSVCHPKWNPPLEKKTDIAVLKLAKPLKFSKTIQPIELPRQGEEVPKDAKCIAAGWGATEYSFNKTTGDLIYQGTSRHLQEVPVRVATPDECAAIIAEASLARGLIDRETKLCNRVANNRTTLGGDSGSALVCERGDAEVLYGIVSSGVVVPWQHVAGNFYTKVSAFTDWIQAEIKLLNVVA